jgi:hypothetical protein
MKYLTALLGLAVVVAAMACSSGVKLPPVSPEDVEVFMPGVPIADEYKVMAAIEEAFSMDTQDAAIIDRVKERAAELGADAVIIDRIRATSEGAIEQNLAQEQQKIVNARAIYFPSRHPELAEQQ